MWSNRRRPLPVRTRIALTIFAVATAALVAMSLAVYLRFDAVLSANLDEAVLARAASNVAAAGSQPLPPDSRAAGEPEELFRVYRANGMLASDQAPGLPPSSEELELVAQARPGRESLRTIRYGDGAYRVAATATLGADGQALVVLTGLQQEQVTDPLGSLRTTLLFAVPLTAAALAAAAFLIARRALRPVAEMTAAARAITAGDISQRLRVESQDELGELATTLNTMLRRLEATIERERRFASDASHELRTPLAAIATALEVTLARERPAPDYQHAMGAMKGEVQRLHGLVERLLYLSRVDAGAQEAEFAPVELHGFLDALLDAFSERQPGARPTLDGPAEAWIRGDLEMLAVAFNNVLQNSVLHAGPSARVTVKIVRAAGLVTVEFRDDGPGIPAELADTVFQRFRRGRDAGARGGTGLGLAIAQAVAQAHGGSVGVVPGGSGVCIRFAFPAEGPPAG